MWLVQLYKPTNNTNITGEWPPCFLSPLVFLEACSLTDLVPDRIYMARLQVACARGCHARPMPCGCV